MPASEEEQACRVTRLLDEVQEARKAGRLVDLASSQQEHPDVADELPALLRVAERLDRLAESWNPPAAEDPAAFASLGQPDPHSTTDGPTTPAWSLGEYVVERQIGGGSYGRVYLCTDPVSGLRVAVKVLIVDDLPEDVVRVRRARFVREAKILARIRHPNICQIIKLDLTQDVPFIVMLYYERTLEQLLDPRRGQFPDRRRAVELALQIVDALAAAHAETVVHRDLKPANLFLDANRLVVGDFGLARDDHLPRVTATGAGLGTPAYMSPEQARRHLGKARPDEPDVNARADVYSFGVILYQMLTGIVPVPEQSFLVASHIADEAAPRDLYGRLDHVDPALKKIVLRAMAYRPEDRPEARELADELRAWLKRQDIDRPKRKNLVFGLVGAAALAGVLAGTGYWMGRSSTPAEPLKNPGYPIGDDIFPARRPAFVSEKDILRAVHAHLTGPNVPEADRPHLRYFTLASLANNRKHISPEQLRRARAALGAGVHRLSLNRTDVPLRAVDADELLYVVDLRDLGWDEDGAWKALKRKYPYGLMHDDDPDEGMRKLAGDVYQLAGRDLLWLRADWLLAEAEELLEAVVPGAGDRKAGLREAQAAAEPILAWYAQDLDLETAAVELGFEDTAPLRAGLLGNPDLAKYETRLADGGRIPRKEWSSLEFQDPIFQQLARALQRGTPRGD